MKRIDLTGRKIGRLTVVSYAYSYVQPSKQKRAMWNVRCDCGNEKVVSTSNLMSGTVSCGCYLKEIRGKALRKEFGMANLNYLFLQYKHRAARKGIEFELTKEKIKEVGSLPCYYCGSKPKTNYLKRSHYGTFKLNGIDRISSDIGYTLDNIRPCCKRCNHMKNDMTEKDFYDKVKNIYKFLQLDKC